MRKLAVLALMGLMAVTAVIANPRPAEAGRQGAIIAGVIGGIALGAILAHKHRRKHSHYYYYRSDRPAYYSGGYYRPYSYYYAPRRVYRVYPRNYRRHHW